MLVEAIKYCYETLDIIDDQLIAHGASRLAGLVELANLSSMVGNLLGAGLAESSRGLYKRNKPHTYPDLLPQKKPGVDLELKIALETNRPKGIFQKPGPISRSGTFLQISGRVYRGTENRGLRVFVWEAKVGILEETDFDISDTAGDSGKTAVIKTKVFNEKMGTVYLIPDLNPYAKPRIVEERRLALPDLTEEFQSALAVSSTIESISYDRDTNV